MSVITEADKVCGSPSDAQKQATQQMEDCEVGKESDQDVRRSNPLSKPPARKCETASRNCFRCRSSLKQTSNEMYKACNIAAYCNCMRCMWLNCWRPRPPQKFRKSHWCVPFTATFSKRRKIGALWSERCDARIFHSTAGRTTQKIFAGELCQHLLDGWWYAKRHDT